MTKKEYSLTAAGLTPSTLYFTYSYTYGNSTWGDLLTKYRGYNIQYDSIGNPTSMRINGLTRTLSWTQGRRLASMDAGSNEVYTYTYNDEGIRTSKTVNGTKHEYLLSGTQVIAEKFGSVLIIYLYDENGSPIGMQFRTSSMAANTFYTYWFEKNLQGDVIAVYNESGTKLISYYYDAWGNVTQNIHNNSGNNKYAALNPFRYRGYYYDTESKLYYLNSRYYNPEIGRFINADGQLNGGLLGYNLFAYCENNPVMGYDPTGTLSRGWMIALGIGAAIVAGAITVASFGAAAPGAICTLTAMGSYVGLNVSAATAVATVVVAATEIAATAYVADTAYAMVTGESVLLDTVFQGNQQAYEAVGVITSVATYGLFQLSANSPGTCFVEGTLVETESGSLPIETVVAGMMVYSYNTETGETALKRVVQTFINESDELVHIKVNGEEIITTPTHPFWVPVKGWTKAIQLRAGDRLQLLNGEYVIVEQVQHELLESPIFVYNFEVEGFHTYYVTDCAILVHNANCGKEQTPDQKALGDLAKEIDRNARKGIFISYEEAQIFDSWAEEYGVKQHHQAYYGSGDHYIMGWDHTHYYSKHVPFK